MFRDRDGWRVQWRENGERFSQRFDTKKEAERFDLERKLGIGPSVPREIRSPTFEAFAERWLSEYSRVEKRPVSHDEDKRTVRLHLVSALGAKKLCQLKKADLVRLKSELLAKKVKGSKTKTLNPKTVNNILMVAKTIAGFAVDLDLLVANPWLGVKPAKVPARDFDFWQPTERDSFYEKAKPLHANLADLAYLACHTGLRKGELAALSWKVVDLERRKLKVASSYSTRLGIVSATKNGEIAEVPLNRAAVDLLTERASSRDGLTVFPVGLFQNLRRDFTVLCKRAGVRPIRFHDTRHTFASTLAMAGVDLLKIQELMRHKSYQMTLRYAHLHPSHLAGATDVLCQDAGTQVARRSGSEKGAACNPLESWRTLSDSNARPSGSKRVAC